MPPLARALKRGITEFRGGPKWTKSGGDGTTGFQQRFQMGFRRLLKAEERLAPVASVGMTARQEAGLGGGASGCLRFSGLNLDPVGLDLVIEGLAADAEALCGFELVAGRLLEHLDNCVSLDALEQGEVGVAGFLSGGAGL